jgi:glycosyltransferase involved in cell wall biosynthesis
VTPRVSLGAPVYNGERFLEEALRSILAQTYQDFELIICDNASTDRTREICLDLASRDPRVRFFQNEVNLGAARNHDRVLHPARGEYFRWCQHDDLMAPQLLERCVVVMDRAPASVVVCHPRTTMIDAHGIPLGLSEEDMDLRMPSPSARFRHALWHVSTSNPMFGLIRTEVLRRTAGHPTYPSGDQVLICELALIGQLWELPDRLFLRRRHEGSTINAYSTPEEVARWLDPQARVTVIKRTVGRIAGHIESIRRVPLASSERLRSYRALAAWALPRWRIIAGEYRRALRGVHGTKCQ